MRARSTTSSTSSSSWNSSFSSLRAALGELEQARDETAHLLRLAVEVVEQAPALLRIERDVAA